MRIRDAITIVGAEARPPRSTRHDILFERPFLGSIVVAHAFA
jgi:hypothetical protein